MDFKLFVLAVFIFTYTTNVKSFNISEYRLPKWSIPNKYILNVDLRWPEQETFRGYTWIDLNVTGKYASQGAIFNLSLDVQPH